MTSPAADTHLELPEPGTYRVDSARSSLQVTSRGLFGRRPCSAVFRFDAGLFTVGSPGKRSTVFAHLTLVSSGGPRPLLGSRKPEAAGGPVTVTFGSAALHQDRQGWILHGEVHAGPATTHLDLAISELVGTADGLRVTADSTVDARAFHPLPGWPRSRRRLKGDCPRFG